MAGLLFDLHRSGSHEWMHRLQTVLETALGQKMVLPERKVDSIEAFLLRFPGVKRLMIDGTKRPVQRPQDPEQQQLNYSGKKKRHTRKHLAAVDESKQVLVLSLAHEGKLLRHSLPWSGWHCQQCSRWNSHWSRFRLSGLTKAVWQHLSATQEAKRRRIKWYPKTRKSLAHANRVFFVKMRLLESSAIAPSAISIATELKTLMTT